MDALYRHWLMLQMIPRQPRKIDGAEIEARLLNNGYKTTRRTIQRDLEKLAGIFPLGCDDSTKPYGWSWKAEAAAFNVPAMDPSAALTFCLVERHLSQMIPRCTLRSLQPHLVQAGRTLDRLGENMLRSWPDKIHIIPRGQPLRAPELATGVLEVVYDALLGERRFRTTYRRRGEAQPKELEVSPLGLIFQDRLVYLVGTLWDYDDPVLLLLHRMEAAAGLDKPVAPPPMGFDLQDYADRELKFPAGERSFRLEVLFDPAVVAHLTETPLSADQQLTPHKDGRVRVRATVADTAQLRWWLQGFGGNVEVVRPKKLREEFREVSLKLAERYKASAN